VATLTLLGSCFRARTTPTRTRCRATSRPVVTRDCARRSRCSRGRRQRGRSGVPARSRRAGFPAGRKWSMLRKAPISYLVVNGDESEPATFKDHLLLERDPNQLVEGVIIAAYALQVSSVYIFVRGEFALGLERVQQAVNDAYELGALGSKILGSEFSIDVVVHPGAGAYICGEETALIEALEGKRGFPRIKPPFFRRRRLTVNRRS